MWVPVNKESHLFSPHFLRFAPNLFIWHCFYISYSSKAIRTFSSESANSSVLAPLFAAQPPWTGHVFALAKRGWNKWIKKGELGAQKAHFSVFRVCHFDFFRIRVHFVFFRVPSTFCFLVRSSFPLLRFFRLVCATLSSYSTFSSPSPSLVFRISFPCEPLLTDVIKIYDTLDVARRLVMCDVRLGLIFSCETLIRAPCFIFGLEYWVES